MRTLCAHAACLFLFALPTVALATEGASSASSLSSSLATVTAINDSQSKAGMVIEASFKELTKTVGDMAQEVNTALLSVQAMKEESRRQTPAFISWLWMIARQNQDGQLLTDEARQTLDMIAEQSVLGYTTVVNAASSALGRGSNEEGIYAKGLLPATANLYETHVNLFCLPGARNAPSGCGSLRRAAGIKSGETFIDFMVGEKTWQRAYVLDAMKSARAYFGFISDTAHLDDLRVNRDEFVRRQAKLARNNLRLSMMNYLAARRAPTSGAAAMAQMLVMANVTDTAQTDSLNINAMCAKDEDKQTPFEKTACSYTSDPSSPGGERIISQAAIDRVTQYDLYFSPRFFQIVRDPQNAGTGPLNKIQVVLKAQQLAQDYQHLRMLQMKVAATAVRTVSGGF
jgi:hypothetical protein